MILKLNGLIFLCNNIAFSLFNSRAKITGFTYYYDLTVDLEQEDQHSINDAENHTKGWKSRPFDVHIPL